MKRSAAFLLSVVAVSADFYLGIQHCEDDQGLYVVSIQNYVGDCNVETAYFEKLWATLYMTIKTCVRTTYTPGLPYSYFLAHEDSSVAYTLVMSYSSKSRCETAQAALLAEIQSATTETALNSFWDSNGYQDAIAFYATGDTDCFDAKVGRVTSLPGSCPQAPYAYSKIKFVAYAGTVADVAALGEAVSDGCSFPGETCPIEGRTVGQTDPPSPSTPPPLPPQPPASPADAGNHSTNDGAATETRPGVVVGGVVGGVVAILLIVVIAVVLKKKKTTKKSVTPS